MSSTSEMYSPGTQLTYYIGGRVHPSFADTIHPATSVTVITDGNVFITAGIGAGTIMKYVDWLILAGGKPIPSSTPIPQFAALRAAAIGTKFKWILNEETYRIAIQTADGVLQVKSITDGGAEVHDDACACNGCLYNYRLPLKKTFFVNEDFWRSSLPHGGIITTTMPGPRSKGERMAQAHNPYEDDRNKLQEYMRRFNIRSKVIQHKNMLCMRMHGTPRLRAVIGDIEYDVGLKGTPLASHIAVRAPFAPVRLFESIEHMTYCLGGKPSFYVRYYGRKIQLPSM